MSSSLVNRHEVSLKQLSIFHRFDPSFLFDGKWYIDILQSKSKKRFVYFYYSSDKSA